MTKRTLENCSVIKKATREWAGHPEQRNGKCMGYGAYDDEPCDECKACPLLEGYGEE